MELTDKIFCNYIWNPFPDVLQNAYLASHISLFNDDKSPGQSCPGLSDTWCKLDS